MNVAVYARVSTMNGQDPEMQLRELREYCERRSWDIAGEYVDLGISGTKEKRLKLDRLMAEAHRRRFDAVIVWKFNRFARSVSHLLRALEMIQQRNEMNPERLEGGHFRARRQDGLYRSGCSSRA